MVSVYQTGYGVNDPYYAYQKLGSPSQLTPEQVKIIKGQNSDKPIAQSMVKIGASGKFEKQLAMRQNDVFLITVNRVD